MKIQNPTKVFVLALGGMLLLAVAIPTLRNAPPPTAPPTQPRAAAVPLRTNTPSPQPAPPTPQPPEEWYTALRLTTELAKIPAATDARTWQRRIAQSKTLLRLAEKGCQTYTLPSKEQWQALFKTAQQTAQREEILGRNLGLWKWDGQSFQINGDNIREELANAGVNHNALRAQTPGPR
jgi:hypothetical protein